MLVEHLARGPWIPHLACVRGPLAEEARARGISVHIVEMPRLRRSTRFLVDTITYARRIAHIVGRMEARVLIANTVRAAIYGSLAARMAHVPFIWHMHDFWLGETRPRRTWLDRAGKRLLCAAATRVIANSFATASHLPCTGKVSLVYNGIRIENYDPGINSAPFRAMYGIPPAIPVVGTVGRLRPWKGQDRFLRAMAQVARAVPEAWFLIVGGTPFQVEEEYPQRLRALASRLGIAQRTIFTGHIPEVQQALAAMSIFVHAGDPEPFGLVVVEAMSMAKPVVGFAHGALPEIVADGETGVLVAPGDEDTLARVVIDLLRKPEEAQRLGTQGRERAQALFTAERMARDFEQALLSVVE